MKITPTEIISDGPGIDLSNLPDGISVKMSDPVEDPAYARNAVTLVYDLTGCEHVGLAFAAKEFGDEPHSPPPSPFGDDAAFDGVAVSVDGTAWYEVKALRDLRSDRFLNFDIDLDAEIAQLGLSYNSQFRIRFCQYDNNPAPMDGVFLHGIELTADLSPPVFHLPMDDNAADATVRDASAAGLDQVFIDPTGDPNTAAHSVPGPNGQTALAFDGVDDLIAFGRTLLGEFFAAGCDFSLAFWYKSADPGSTNKYFFRRADAPSLPLTRVSAANDRFYWRVGWGDGYVDLLSATGVLDDQWRHVVCRRRGDTLALWVDGTAHDTRTDPDYANNLFVSTWDHRAIGQTYSNEMSDWPFQMADLRVYDRALRDEEIEAMSQTE